jgi:hypothetical protein
MSEAAERMSRVDTAWLRMDNDVNLMMIVGVWLLHPAVTLQAVRDRIADKLLKYDRFGQIAAADATGAHWRRHEAFDITEHVLPLRLDCQPGQSEHQALQAACGELASAALDPSRPLWQFHLVEDFEGGSAMVARIHHCIGDGIALTSVMMAITDGGSDPPRRRRKTTPAHDHDNDWLADAVIKPLSDLAVKAVGMYGDGVAKSLGALSSPQQGGMDLARSGMQVLKDV